MSYLYSIIDNSTGKYGAPALSENDEVAIRCFKRMCCNPNFPRNDYNLVLVADVDDDTMIIDGNFEHIVIKRGCDFTNEELVDTYVEALTGRVNELNEELTRLENEKQIQQTE